MCVHVPQMSQFIVQCLNPFRKPDCKLGRISNTEDFKHLARKVRLNNKMFTHAIRSGKPLLGLYVVRAQRKHWSAFNLKGKVSSKPKLHNRAPTNSFSSQMFVYCASGRDEEHIVHVNYYLPLVLFYSFLSKSSFQPVSLQRAAFCVFSMVPGGSVHCVFREWFALSATRTYHDSEDMGTINRKTSWASLI